MELQDHFHIAMINVYETAKDHEYFATYFKRILDEFGGVITAKRLLKTSEPQTGLFRLWELNLLHKSMEALVIQKRFRQLFNHNEVNEANRRLEELGYIMND